MEDEDLLKDGKEEDEEISPSEEGKKREELSVFRDEATHEIGGKVIEFAMAKAKAEEVLIEDPKNELNSLYERCNELGTEIESLEEIVERIKEYQRFNQKESTLHGDIFGLRFFDPRLWIGKFKLIDFRARTLEAFSELDEKCKEFDVVSFNALHYPTLFIVYEKKIEELGKAAQKAEKILMDFRDIEGLPENQRLYFEEFLKNFLEDRERGEIFQFLKSLPDLQETICMLGETQERARKFLEDLNKPISFPGDFFSL